METSPVFSLETAISQWRQPFAAISAENLEELEAHLRDSVSCQQARGLSEEEAFVLAAHQIGAAPAVAAEYAKAHPEAAWAERALWMLIGTQLFILISRVAEITRSFAVLPQVLLRWLQGTASLQLQGLDSAVWIGHYFILAALLVLAFRHLQRRHSRWTQFAEALRARPLAYCLALSALSFAIGLASLGSSLLPALLQSWAADAHNHNTYFPNLTLMVLIQSGHALLLPALTYWLLRRHQPALAPLLNR